MKSLALKITPSLLNRIVALERLSGIWDRLSLAEPPESAEALHEGAVAAFALDGSSPERDEEQQIDAYEAAFASRFVFSPEAVAALLCGITLQDAAPVSLLLRSVPQDFALPSAQHERDETIFRTVQPFLIEQRLTEILGWANDELESKNLHPVIVSGIFQLVFLQLSPFRYANHRLALLIVWHLLADSGFSFVRHRHFAPELLAHITAYAAALRQAEKTTFTNWSSLNIWLEFFAQLHLTCLTSLVDSFQTRSRAQELSDTQRMIVEVIRHRGTASREAIASASGINISTVKYNLALLSRRGILAREGGGRTTSYKVV